jgi:hypothetical protein
MAREPTVPGIFDFMSALCALNLYEKSREFVCGSDEHKKLLTTFKNFQHIYSLNAVDIYAPTATNVSLKTHATLYHLYIRVTELMYLSLTADVSVSNKLKDYASKQYHDDNFKFIEMCKPYNRDLECGDNTWNETNFGANREHIIVSKFNPIFTNLLLGINRVVSNKCESIYPLYMILLLECVTISNVAF